MRGPVTKGVRGRRIRCRRAWRRPTRRHADRALTFAWPGRLCQSPSSRYDFGYFVKIAATASLIFLSALSPVTPFRFWFTDACQRACLDLPS
jgi:hypothetical protein